MACGFCRQGQHGGDFPPPRPQDVGDDDNGHISDLTRDGEPTWTAPRQPQRPASEPRGRGVGAGGDDGLRVGDRPGDPRGPAPGRRLLPRPHRAIFDAILRLTRRERAGRRPHRLRGARPRAASSRRSAGATSSPASPPRPPAPGNAKHYGEIVKQNALLRRLTRAAQTIQQSVDDREGEPSELVEQAEALLFKVAHEERAADFRELGDDPRGRDRASSRSSPRATPRSIGTPSGFRDLDTVTGGFQPGNLIVIAARPAMGKSAMVCNIAENVALEARQAGRVLLARDVGGGAGTPLHRLPGADLRATSCARARSRARTGPGSSRPATSSTRRRCGSTTPPTSACSSCAPRRGGCTPRRRRADGGLGLIIVDYIQLMRAEDPRANRVEQVGQISRGLKILARELDVPVIAHLPALPRARAAPRQAADPLRPARVAARSSRTRTSSASSTATSTTTRSPRTRGSPS